MEEKQEHALTVRQAVTPQLWQMISQIAPAMHQSRLFGVASPEQAAAIMLKGYELGLGLAASFEFINVIQGKPSLTPRGALALIMQSPEYGDMKIEEGEGYCQVWMKRRNGFEHTVRFTIEDATRAGLVRPDSGWQKYQANMLRWRAVGFCADVVFSDVIGGMKRADELGADVSEDGNMIDGTWTVTPPTEYERKPTLEDLLQSHTAEEIMAANEGRIPATEEEVVLAAKKLEAE